MTETWGLIHCHKRRNNTGVVQGVCSGRVVVELFRQILPLSSLHCLIWGQHKTQRCLNPSAAALLGTVVAFWLWKSVHFLLSLHIFSWKWNNTEILVNVCRWIGGICTLLSEELKGSYLVLSVAFLCANKIGYSGLSATYIVIWFWIAWKTVCTTPAICQDIKVNLNLMYF